MQNPGSTPDRHDLLAAELADHYLIEEELGRGGSATVYLAQDLRHGRRVALKVLHSALGAALGVERFQREIRTQARLQHPHILPLYDSGSAAGRLYYTMPYVEAGSLRDRLRRIGRLEPPAAVQLALEVASALGYAHRLGIIHRDLKPENIMLSPTGEAILADFGIAYALEQSGDAADPDNPSGPRLTETGVTVGTPTYMSPEQAAGDEELTGRSDQYALAAVIYEALAGSPPFIGANARAILAKKLTATPASLGSVRADVPEAVDQVLMRALSRHPHERFDSMEELARALTAGSPTAITPVSLPRASRTPPAVRPRRARWLLAVPLALALAAAAWLLTRDDAAPGPSAAAEAETRVLAVLPFKNLGDPADQYFADGLTEELTSRLAALGGLRVISRTSTEHYRESPKSLREIGADLQAGYVLEGSVRWERGDSGYGRVRVTPRLIGVAQDSPLWSEEYEVELTEVFRVQSEIAERVTTALDLALRSPERASLAAGETATPEAYDFYLRGNDYAARSYSRSNVEAALDLYRRAVALDSGFAPAWARLSRAHSAMYWFGHDRSPDRIDSARVAVERALRLAPELAEARIARGYLYYWGMSDYPRALEEFEAARRRQPGNSELLTAIGYVERRRGQWDSALARFEEAVRYDPRSALRALDLADTYMSLRNYPEAERTFDRAIQLSPDWAEPWAYKAMLQLAWRGDRERAHAVIAEALNRVSAGRLAQALTIPDAISGALLTADTMFAKTLEAIRPASFDGDSARYHLLHAEAAGFRGDHGAERAHGDSALSLLERQLLERPDDPKLLARTGLAYARAGRHADAIRLGRRAAELLPPSRDANSGPYVLARLAQIYMLAGDHARALDTLEPLLEMPSWITPALLRSDPTWSPLRTEPRFARLAGSA
jgi:TolB-like protein/tetratricopeptide (TPR) repeat protein/tRNA A-37 threonylcarbamoyl transferase component Bud32